MATLRKYLISFLFVIPLSLKIKIQLKPITKELMKEIGATLLTTGMVKLLKIHVKKRSTCFEINQK